MPHLLLVNTNKPVAFGAIVELLTIVYGSYRFNSGFGFANCRAGHISNKVFMQTRYDELQGYTVVTTRMDSTTGIYSGDGELLRCICEHDEAALAALYDRYADLVYSFALHTLQSPALAEEVTQDTFLKIWYHADGWDPAQGKFSSWLLTVTRYTAIDRLRKEQRRVLPIEVSTIALDGEAQETGLPDGEEIRIFIGQLPQEQAQAIEYAFFRGILENAG